MSLIKKAKLDPHAFIELYDMYVERTYHYFLKRLEHPEEAEDLSALVWEKVLNKIQTLRSNEESAFAAWLFAIARNELNHYYKNRIKNSHQELPDFIVDEAQRPDDLLRDDSDLNLVKHCILSLPEQQRETVELRYFADLRNKEIALILKISEKTVASNLSRALKALKKNLEKLQ